MTDAELVAWRKGRGAGRDNAVTHMHGRPSCPYDPARTPDLAKAWLRGYDDGRSIR